MRGEPESRTNFGYLCMKGMMFYKIMTHPDRLKMPLYREKKTDKFREISWDQALDIAAKKNLPKRNKNSAPPTVPRIMARVSA